MSSSGTIIGGYENNIIFGSTSPLIIGGSSNTIGRDDVYGAIIGGSSNNITASFDCMIINSSEGQMNGTDSLMIGGSNNVILNDSNGNDFIIGGSNNSIEFTNPNSFYIASSNIEFGENNNYSSVYGTNGTQYGIPSIQGSTFSHIFGSNLITNNQSHEAKAFIYASTYSGIYGCSFGGITANVLGISYSGNCSMNDSADCVISLGSSYSSIIDSIGSSINTSNNCFLAGSSIGSSINSCTYVSSISTQAGININNCNNGVVLIGGTTISGISNFVYMGNNANSQVTIANGITTGSNTVYGSVKTTDNSALIAFSVVGQGGTNYGYLAPGGNGWNVPQPPNSLATTDSPHTSDSLATSDSLNTSNSLSTLSTLPIYSWSFKGASEKNVGPTSQDFSNDTSISVNSLAGFALSSVKELNNKITGDTDLLKKSNAELRERINNLKKLIGEKK